MCEGVGGDDRPYGFRATAEEGTNSDLIFTIPDCVEWVDVFVVGGLGGCDGGTIDMARKIKSNQSRLNVTTLDREICRCQFDWEARRRVKLHNGGRFSDRSH